MRRGIINTPLIAKVAFTLLLTPVSNKVSII